MDVAAFSQLVANLGFPIVVAMFLLVRMERVIGELTKAVTNLTAIVSKISERDRAP